MFLVELGVRGDRWMIMVALGVRGNRWMFKVVLGVRGDRWMFINQLRLLAHTKQFCYISYGCFPKNPAEY